MQRTYDQSKQFCSRLLLKFMTGAFEVFTQMRTRILCVARPTTVLLQMIFDVVLKILVVIIPSLWGPAGAILEMCPGIYYVLFDPIVLDLTDQNPIFVLITFLITILRAMTGPAAQFTRTTRTGQWSWKISRSTLRDPTLRRRPRPLHLARGRGRHADVLVLLLFRRIVIFLTFVFTFLV